MTRRHFLANLTRFVVVVVAVAAAALNSVILTTTLHFQVQKVSVVSGLII